MLITSNGTTVIPVNAGRDYVLSAAGTFGGGTLTPQWNDGVNDVPVTDSGGALAITTASAYVVTAPTSSLKLVLAGAASPSITANVFAKYVSPYK
jgi:hypothetical protein